MKIGKKVEKAVEEYINISKVQLALELGVSSKVFYNWYDRDSIESRHIVKLSKLSGLPIGWFFDLPSENLSDEEKKRLEDHDEVVETLQEVVKSKEELISSLKDQVKMLKDQLKGMKERFVVRQKK